MWWLLISLQLYGSIVENPPLKEESTLKQRIHTPVHISITQWEDFFLKLGNYRRNASWLFEIRKSVLCHTTKHAYMHTCIHAYMRTCVHTYIHTYINTCINKYINVIQWIHACTKFNKPMATQKRRVYRIHVLTDWYFDARAPVHDAIIRHNCEVSAVKIQWYNMN